MEDRLTLLLLSHLEVNTSVASLRQTGRPHQKSYVLSQY